MRLLCLPLALCLFWPSSAIAQSETREDAQLLFDSGLKNMLQGEYGIGCALIKRSLQIDPTPGTIFTLAECYARAGKAASAVEMYDEFLALYAQLPPDQRENQHARAELSKKERTRLLSSVPWLTVVMPDSAPIGTSVTMGDKTFPQNLLGIAIAVDPGRHRFTTRAPGGRLTEQEVDLEPGQRRTLLLNVVAGPQGTEGASGGDEGFAVDTAETGLSPWFYVAGSVGLAGLATAAVSGILLLDKRSTILDRCNRNDAGRWECLDSAGRVDQKGIDALETAQNVLAPVTTAGFAVAGLGLGIAALIWFTSPDESPTTAAQELVPVFAVTPTGPSIGLYGKF